jgi:hypothetical protein
MKERKARRFARTWLRAWNEHDVDAIVRHHRDHVVYSSPFVAELTGRRDGTLRGSEEVREYVRRALAAFPELELSEPHVYVGSGSVSVVYRGVRDLVASETFVLDEEGRAERVYAHYC